MSISVVLYLIAVIFLTSEATGTFLNVDGRNIRVCNQSEVNSTDQAPGLVNRRSIHGQCIENRTDLTKIVWNDPVGVDKVDHYLIYIKPIYSHDIYLHCFQTRNKETYFYFKEEHGFVKHTEYYVKIETYPKLKDSSATLESIGGCPLKGGWSNWGRWGHCSCTEPCGDDREICTGRKSRTRVCKYKDKKNIETYSYNCPKHQNDDEDSMNCIVRCREKLVGLDEKNKKKLSTVQTLFIVIGCFAFLLVFFVAIYIWQRLHQKQRRTPLAELTEEEMMPLPSVYISYMLDEHKETSLLKLISCLRNYGIHCIIDLLCTVEINSSGGLPNWLPGKISTADKIIVILSEDYIKTLNSVDSDVDDVPDKVCKIHTEFKLINTMLYHTCQKTPKIILVSMEGVRSDGIPHVFRGMHHCAYPKKMDAADEDLLKLLGVLLDTEPIQMA